MIYLTSLSPCRRCSNATRKFKEIASFLDAQLDKLHVLINKPQDIDFEDITTKQPDDPARAENKRRFEAKLEEMRNNPIKWPKVPYQRERSLFDEFEP